MQDPGPVRRYRLHPHAPRVFAAVGMLILGMTAYSLFREWRTGGLSGPALLMAALATVLMGAPLLAFVVRFTGIYVELTPDALNICGVFRDRIPLHRIRSVRLSAPGERVRYDQLITATHREWSGWIRATDRVLLVVEAGRQNIAFEFADPEPVFRDLRQRLQDFQQARTGA